MSINATAMAAKNAAMAAKNAIAKGSPNAAALVAKANPLIKAANAAPAKAALPAPPHHDVFTPGKHK